MVKQFIYTGDLRISASILAARANWENLQFFPAVSSVAYLPFDLCGCGDGDCQTCFPKRT